MFSLPLQLHSMEGTFPAMTHPTFYLEDYERPLHGPQTLWTNRAFLYGEGATTCSLLRRGKMLFSKDHLHRLEQTWMAYYPRCSRGLLRGKFQKNLSALPSFHQDHFIKISLFTNDRERSFDRIADHTLPNLILYADKLSPLSSPTLKTMRKKSALSRYLGKIPFYLEEIHDRKIAGCDVLYLDSHNNVMEASVSNVFFVFHKQIITPAPTPTIFSGISRKHFIGMLKRKGFSYQERTIKKNELPQMEGVLLTNSLHQATVVNQLDGRPLNCPLAFDLQRLYLQYCQEYFENHHDKIPLL